MELPPWLKIENLIGNLNFTGWFKEWFKRKNITRIDNVTNIININLPAEIEPSVESPDNADQPKLVGQKAEVKFTTDQMELINKINIVHKINGVNDYDFQEDYKWALYYIQHKPANDWPYNAALRIAQAMQDIDFFSAFEEINDPERKNQFDDIKNKINYLYNKIIQELRHTDKRNQIERQFKGTYHNVLQKKPKIENAHYEDIFNEFQDLLIKLFDNFKLKQ